MFFMKKQQIMTTNKVIQFIEIGKLSKIVDASFKNDINKHKKKHTILWIPSIESFRFLIIVFILILGITHIGLESKWGTFLVFDIFTQIKLNNISSDSSIYQNLISINIGIGAVIIGLAFFVAQSLMDKDDPDRAKVLLYKSKFYPLLVSQILIFVILLTGDLNYSIIPVLIIMGILVILSLGNTIIILIMENELEKAKVKVFTDILKETFHDNLNFELKRRIANNELVKLSNLYSKVFGNLVSFGYININLKSDYENFYLRSEGNLVDIDFLNLEKLIRYILSFNIYDGINVGYETQQLIKSDVEKNNNSTLVYIQLNPYTDKHNNQPILRISKSLLNNNEKLRYIINSQFGSIFKLSNIQSYEDKARFELLKLKRKCLKAINEDNSDNFLRDSNLYLVLIEVFYDSIKNLGDGFSREQAESERTSFFSDRLKPLEWFKEDVNDIFVKAINNKNNKIVSIGAHLPIKLAMKSINKGDHLIYQSFINYPIQMYLKGHELRNSDSRISELLIDQSWRYTKELSDFYLFYENEDNLYLNSNFKDFAQYIVKVFQSLIIKSFDLNDAINYKIFVSRMLELSHCLNNNNIDEDFNDNEKTNILNGLINESIFGVNSWLLSNKDIQSDESRKQFYFEVSKYLPEDIVKLTKIFLRSSTFEKEREWGWDIWEIEKHDESEVFSINILEKLEVQYLIKSLQILSKTEEYKIKLLELPITKEFSIISRDTGSLQLLLVKIERDPNCYDGIITLNERNKSKELHNLLLKVVERQEDIERKITRETEISSEIVKSFKNNFYKNFNSTVGIRDIMIFYDLYKDMTEYRQYSPNYRFGVNTFFNKIAFIDKSKFPDIYFHGIENAFDFGRSIKSGENSKIIEILGRNILEYDENEFANRILVLENIHDYIALSINHAAMFLPNNYGEELSYQPKWHNNFPKEIENKYANGLDGIIKCKNSMIPVYSLLSDSDTSEIIIIKKEEFGEFIQYSPNDDFTKTEDVVDFFEISITELNRNSKKFNEYLENPPLWLKDKGDVEFRSNYLEEKVVIQIYESFEFKLLEESSGLKFNISK